MTNARNRAVRYWILVLAIACVVAVVTVLAIESVNARSDAIDQLNKSRAAASRRIDMLQNQIIDLNQHNVNCERANALLEKGIHP